MSTGSSSSQSSPERADQVRGVFKIVEEFMSTTNSLFQRLYSSLSSSTTIVEKAKLERAQSQQRALRRRLRVQNIELARLTGVLAAIEEGVIMQDTQGRIVLMNEAARELLGTVRRFWDSPLGQLFKEHVTTQPNPAVAGLIDPLSEPQRVEVNGRLLGARLAAVYSADKGEALGTVMVLSDLAQQNLGERLKTSFITQMSHELMTPLTSIKGMSDLLLNLPEGRPPDRRFLETISRNVAIMDRMIVELLDISEIDAGNFTIRRNSLRLDEQISYVIAGLEPRLRKAKVKVYVEVVNDRYLEFLGDERRIRWALNHLIDNAINYTEPDGRITVEVGQIVDGNLLLKVRDTGVGISQDDLPRIFDRFYRGKAVTADGKLIDPRGLGQGLYVANAVAKAHDGSLSVASTVGKGSTFTMSLPLAQEDAV